MSNDTLGFQPGDALCAGNLETEYSQRREDLILGEAIACDVVLHPEIKPQDLQRGGGAAETGARIVLAHSVELAEVR